MTEKSDATWAGGGARSEIVTVGDPRLRIRLPSVDYGAEVRDTCEKLVSLLREMKGAGLAAPQIGIRLPVAVVEVRKTDFFPDRPESPLYVFINPQIIRHGEETVDGWEGCFSVPGIMGRVRRYERVEVKFLNKEGEEVSQEFGGYTARVVQHEIDHLNGVIFLDRMLDMTSITTVENYKRFHHGDVIAPESSGSITSSAESGR
jgi:peptide deformylase